MPTSIYAQRIEQLRQVMRSNHIDLYIVFTSDPHLSEYLPDYWKSREWLSGFTGSSGTLLVTQEFAGLWTDSRYWIVAEKQLQGSNIELKKWHNTETHYHKWLSDNLKAHSTIGFDGNTVSVQAYDALKSLAQKYHWQINSQTDLLQLFWLDRPSLPNKMIYEHDKRFCALSRMDKIACIREKLREHHAEYHLISSLDDIAWILNLRGEDIEYNPVFLSYLLISTNKTTLFVNQSQLSTALQSILNDAQINILDYNDVTKQLNQLPASSSILYDPQKTAINHLLSINASIKRIEATNPSTLLKSCKADSEITHLKEAMVEDGVALCQFFAWLESELAQQKTITELTIDEKLEYYRSQRANYVSCSFATIAGFNENGAMPHYQATKESYSKLTGSGLLLIDSGAQYLNGTTDITRVVPIGEITPEQKRDYTLVLKAHIAISRAVFPNNIPGQFIDVLARDVLWKEQLDFGHGTGHGVGYFLNVHEGPQTLSYRSPIHSNSGLKVGMVTSNEPGLYREGQWGIRLENLMATRKKDDSPSHFGDFLYFETLTLCPFEISCIETTLLTKEELNWLNGYHQTVYEKLSPKLTGDALSWLEKSTQWIQ